MPINTHFVLYFVPVAFDSRNITVQLLKYLLHLEIDVPATLSGVSYTSLQDAIRFGSLTQNIQPLGLVPL